MYFDFEVITIVDPLSACLITMLEIIFLSERMALPALRCAVVRLLCVLLRDVTWFLRSAAVF